MPVVSSLALLYALQQLSLLTQFIHLFVVMSHFYDIFIFGMQFISAS